MDVMFRIAVPVFLSVTSWTVLLCPTKVLGKLRLAGTKETTGNVAAIPVPLSVTTWGEPDALSVKVIAPLRGPIAVGVKVTLIVQDALAASDPPHVAGGDVELIA